jgi:4-amino-4-deoxy-L-arabinose transferase-like glycosyltransferase
MTEAISLRKSTLNRLVPYALVLVFALDYLYSAWVWIGWNSRPALGQDVWLKYALALREGGDLPLGNDLPLYPALLSLWVRRAPEAFTWSKLFSLAVGAFTLAAVYRIGRRLFGKGPALLAAAALSVDWLFLSLSMSLRAEVLLPPLFLLAWYTAWRGFEETKSAGRWWFASGLFAGLAYLTKGTGPIFAAAFAVGLACCRKGRLRGAWYAAGFLPFAAALWWANRAMFGDAAHHFSIQHAVWLDSWWELSGKNVADLTFSNYLKAQSWLDLLKREGSGIASFAPLALSCLSPGDSFPVSHLLRWPALAAAAWAGWHARRRWLGALRRLDARAWMTASLFAAFFFLFSWYHQVSPSERFVGPLAPIAFLLLGAALWEAGAPLARRPAVLLGAGALLAGFTALSLFIKVREWGVPDVFAADRLEPAYARAIDWASTRGGTVVFGPSSELPSYLLTPGTAPAPLPERAGAEGLEQWLERSGARAAVVDKDMASNPILAGFIVPEGERGIRVERLPAGWRLTEMEEGRVALLEKD